MLQPMRIVGRLLFQYPSKYQFSKILKMTPLESTQMKSQKLGRSISSAIQFFNLIPAMAESKPPKKALNEIQICQQFISMITQIDMQAFENAIFCKIKQFELEEIIQRLIKFDVINSTLELLIVQPQYTHRLRKFLTNFMNCIFLIFRKDILLNKGRNLDAIYLKNSSTFFNQYMILAELNDRLVINYCLLMTTIKLTHLLDSSRSFFYNQKIVVDYILERNKNFVISKRDFSILIGYVTSAAVGQNYAAKYNDLVQFFISQLTPQWYKDTEYNVKKLLMHFEKIRFDCQKFTDGMKYWIKQEITKQNFGFVISAINELIKIKAKIYYGEPIPPEYSQVLNKIVKYVKDRQYSKKDQKKQDYKQDLVKNNSTNHIQQISKYLIPTLYRSSIWLESIWLYYAEWIEVGKNYKKVNLFDLYSIFQLIQIDKQVIPQVIIKRLQKTKQFLLIKHNLRIDDVNLIKQYALQFGNRMPASYSVQQQICNNLRSVSKKKVQAQVLIRMFIVDILINDKVIIQINGFSHYIDNEERKKISNLKTAFKKRVLSKLGYKFLEYEVETVIDGNLELLKTINADMDRVLAS